MPRPWVRVIKVGGSLFDLPDLRQRLAAWLERQSPALNVFIAGGGALADAIRDIDRLHHLGEQQAHWLCIKAMGLSAKILHALLPGSLLVDDIAVIEAAEKPQENAVRVFDTQNFLRESEPRRRGTKLTHGWQVTSDSIAARVADVLEAEELVLLKSALPSDRSRRAATDAAYVDSFFPTAAAGLRRVRCVNLRDDSFPECDLE